MTFKKAITSFLLLFSLITALPADANERPKIEIGGSYGFNNSWESHGGAFVRANIPIIKYFEAGANLEYLSPKISSVSVILRPQLPVGKGTFFIDGTFLYRGLTSYQTDEFVFAAGLGYKRPYFKVLLGCFGRTLQDKGSAGDFVSEVINPIYHISFTVKPESSIWNVGGGVANFTEFEFERMTYPIFFINGHYDFLTWLGAFAQAQVKPSGMFHMTSTFNMLTIRAGLRFIL